MFRYVRNWGSSDAQAGLANLDLLALGDSSSDTSGENVEGDIDPTSAQSNPSSRAVTPSTGSQQPPRQSEVRTPASAPLLLAYTTVPASGSDTGRPLGSPESASRARSNTTSAARYYLNPPTTHPRPPSLPSSSGPASEKTKAEQGLSPLPDTEESAGVTALTATPPATLFPTALLAQGAVANAQTAATSSNTTSPVTGDCVTSAVVPTAVETSADVCPVAASSPAPTAPASEPSTTTPGEITVELIWKHLVQFCLPYGSSASAHHVCVKVVRS